MPCTPYQYVFDYSSVDLFWTCALLFLFTVGGFDVYRSFAFKAKMDPKKFDSILSRGVVLIFFGIVFAFMAKSGTAKRASLQQHCKVTLGNVTGVLYRSKGHRYYTTAYSVNGVSYEGASVYQGSWLVASETVIQPGKARYRVLYDSTEPSNSVLDATKSIAP